MTELQIIDQTSTCYLYLCGRVAAMPRLWRYGMGQDLLRQMNRLLEELLRAKFATPVNREVHLVEANILLDILRFQIRHLTELKALALNSQEHTLKLLLPIGEQLGGWLRHSRTRANHSTRA